MIVIRHKIYMAYVFKLVCVFRCWLWETLPTQTVWLQPSLLPLSPKRTFPASPVWTTTGLALRYSPLTSFTFWCQSQMFGSHIVNRGWLKTWLYFVSCRWRCAVVFQPLRWRMWSSGGTTPPPNTQMFTTARSTCPAVRWPALMQSRMMIGLKAISLLWVDGF